MPTKLVTRIALTVVLTLFATVLGAEQKAGRASATGDAETGCPLRFDAQTVGLPKTCLFVGRYNGTCGQSAIAIFAGNGDTLVVGFAFDRTGSTGTTYFGGDVQSNTNASLAVWQQSLPAEAANTVSGSVTLEDDGELLRVRVAESPFEVDGCRFGEYVGRFVEMVDAGDAISNSEHSNPAAFPNARRQLN